MGASSSDDNQPSLPSWVKLVRLLCQTIWITILAGILVNIVSNWLFNPASIHIAHGAPVYWLFSQHLWLILTCGAGLFLLTLVVFLLPIHKDTRQSSVPSSALQRNRTRFLAGLHESYNEMLKQLAAPIALKEHEKPELFIPPLQYRSLDQKHRSLPLKTSIAETYKEAGGGLLILGEPGAGKTTLLYQLASELIQLAKQSDKEPLPVIVNLSSWVVKQSLEEWLVKELLQNYNLSRKLGQQWIRNGQLLPLLDGLDEVPEAARAACIDAINTYQSGCEPLVVCSRTAEYVAQQFHLKLMKEIVIEPLTQEQIDKYLIKGGPTLIGLRMVIQQDKALRELATIPLMLKIMALAYQNTSTQALPSRGSMEEQQRQVFADYVKYMLHPNETQRNTPPQHILQWLIWLAQQMQRHGKSVFYIEQIQFDWLSEKRLPRQAYDFTAVRLPGIVLGILISFVMSVFFMRYGMVPTSLIRAGLVGWLIADLCCERTTRLQTTTQQLSRWRYFGRNLLAKGSMIRGAFIGLAAAVSWAGEFFNSGYASPYAWNDWLRDGIITGLAYGLGSTLLSALIFSGIIDEKRGRQRGETSTESWRGSLGPASIGYLRYGVLTGLIFSGVVGFSSLLRGVLVNGLNDALHRMYILTLNSALTFGIVGLYMGLLLLETKNSIQPVDIVVRSWSSFGRSLLDREHRKNTVLVILTLVLLALPTLLGDLANNLIYELSFVLSGAFIYWAVVGFLNGVSTDTFPERERGWFNEGIRRSMRNALFTGLVSAGISGLVWCVTDVVSDLLTYGPSKGLYSGLSIGWGEGWQQGLFFGIVVGIGVGLLSGGLDAFKHGILRVLLWLDGSIPWNYSKFLDTAARYNLLYKVKGGYTFIHPLFLKYIAGLETAQLSVFECGYADNRSRGNYCPHCGKRRKGNLDKGKLK